MFSTLKNKKTEQRRTARHIWYHQTFFNQVGVNETDIEGCDIVCLQSLRHFVHKPDYVSIESEKISFDSLLAEFDLFSELGYDAFQAIDQQNVPQQKESVDFCE